MKYPKILVVGINPWIDNTGINTLINFFERWDKEKIAHIYTREKLPNTRICDTFFRISETRVVRSVLKRKTKTGDRVQNGEAVEDTGSQKLYKKGGGAVKTLLRELVWKFGKWKSNELDTFLQEYSPDVLFFPVYSNVYMCRLQNYVAKKCNKPIVLYVSDDNYSYKSVAKNPLSLLHRFWLRKQEKKLFKRAKEVLVIAPKQKEEYDRIFGINSQVLTKGIDFSQYPFQEKPLNMPVKMVYTGKLIIGRWKSLAAIAEALGGINKTETKVELDIYTTDELTKKQEVALNKNGCRVKGALTLAEVQKVQAQADVLVFVESLERKHKNAARLSFSTKITDYLKSGKCIFSIGDKDIAPIDYFKRYDAAVTATTYQEIGEKLQVLAENPTLILEYGKKAYACGKEHHDKEKMSVVLFGTIMAAWKGE